MNHDRVGRVDSTADTGADERLAHPRKAVGPAPQRGAPALPTPIPSDPHRRKATQVETHPSQTAAQQLGQTEALIRFVEALGAYEFNRWVADGMLCRRYISPDGNIDLTVRVP